ncbi:hypothetical protein FNV43_RR06262 [Rhamnella rubrinervis]|uniref:CASP-like protein n=1 Tax=Rhamnella rubrinervis TaxID=2594499 RepID=A0A8K0HCM9_9ROSA|nr:hypothetical protein FNV43_RR06262 [Rhamnella rubrinervis]
MAFENRGKPAVEKPIKDWRHVVRMVSFLATASATLVMAFSKETKTLVVANIGGVPIKATISAKFQHTPAFVFFVIANGMASLHNLLMIMAEVFRDKMFNNRGVHLVMIAILDMMTVALASAGGGAALFMAMLGKNGNSHARWSKICDKFDSYCDRSGGALIASFVGLVLLLLITVHSIIKLLNHPKPINNIDITLP